jgi:hypothetical protein
VWERITYWSHRRPRSAAAVATLAVVVVLAGLAAGYQASVETAMIAKAHGYIDAIDDRLSSLEGFVAAAEQAVAAAPEGPERLRARRTLAELTAELEVARDERRSYALAITGFTVLSPDERSIAILRQSTLDEIRSAIDLGDVFLARARIRSAMRMYEEGNLFDFDEGDYELLRTELAEVEDLIAASGPL